MKNIAIFASGSGTNAENIAKTFAGGNRIRVAVAVTDHKDAGVVARMEALGIPVLYFPGKVWKESPETIVEALKPYDIDLVVLAGFMRKVADPIIDAFCDRMLNIHPSLLPAYGGKGMYGHHVHEAVIAAGEKQSGVTVHKVTSELDKGEIVMQGILELSPDETPESLESKIHEIEYEIFPRAIVKVLKDLEKSSSAGSNRPPEIPREPTPDELWAKALHMPYTPAENTESPTQESQPNEAVEPRNPKVSEFKAERRERSVPPPVNPAPIPESTAPAYIAEEARPAKSYIVLSIIFMIVFGIFPAIIALFYSFKTRRLNSYSDTNGARRASNISQGWLIASFCLGILFLSLTFPMMIARSLI